MADLKVVLHIERGLKVSLDEVFSVIKLSTFFGVLLGTFGFDLIGFNLLILWGYLKPLESLLFCCPNRMNALIFVLCILFQLWYSDNKFFHFSQVIYSLCSVSMTTVRKRERITAWWWALAGHKRHFTLSCQPIFHMLPILAENEWLLTGDSFDQSSRSKLFWIMTYSIFLLGIYITRGQERDYFDSVVIHIHHKCKAEILESWVP